MSEHLVFAAGFLLAMLASCGPYSGSPCATCVGPYDVTLTSHREALGLGE